MVNFSLESVWHVGLSSPEKSRINHNILLGMSDKIIAKLT